MDFRLIKKYWEIALLFLCLIFFLVVQWQIIEIFWSSLEISNNYSDLFVSLELLCLICCLIIGVYWLSEIALMLRYFLEKHNLKYSNIKTLIKTIGVPILIFSYILLTDIDIIRLRLSEPALMNCVNSPNLCQEETRIGWFYILFITQEGGCTLFMTVNC